MVYVRFYVDNGYCGCDDYIYEKFEDNVSEAYLNELSDDLSYDNAQNHEHSALGNFYSEFENEAEQEEYYENAMTLGGWEYISEEEFNESV